VAFTQGLIFALIAAAVSAMVGIFGFRSLGVLAYLLVLPIPYILAGIVASRRTGKTRTGVFASFWITIGYLLGLLLVSFRAPGRLLFVLLIALAVGVGLGALGGLLGSALRQQRGSMSKKTIGTLYLISLVLEVFPAIPLVAAFTQGYIDPPTLEAIIVLAIIMGLFGIPGIIAWIGTLVNLAKEQAWGWFILVFLFGGIAVLIYVLAGPQPRGVGQALQAEPVAPAPPLNAPFGGPPYPLPAQAYPPAQPISALDILQQRYARGEIDTATFDEMLARLEGRHRQ
jgi:putative membrane protein